MRNPLESWEKSDSDWNYDCIEDPDNFYEYKTKDEFEVGPNDLSLMMKLRNAGTDHRKFMRMIVVYIDITAPLYWWQMIQLLPTSYNQRRTVMLNYEVLANIYKSRKDHKLTEWIDFCDWIKELPYSELITG